MFELGDIAHLVKHLPSLHEALGSPVLHKTRYASAVTPVPRGSGISGLCGHSHNTHANSHKKKREQATTDFPLHPMFSIILNYKMLNTNIF